MPLQHLPHQLSEANFRLYEPHIFKAVTAWPNETEFPKHLHLNSEGRPLSPNTFIARLRDAVLSLKRFGWETSIDKEKLWKMAGTYTISHGTDGSVWWKTPARHGRPADLIQEARERGNQTSPSSQLDVKPWLNWDEEDIKSVACLIDKGRLTGPIILRGEVPDHLRTAFEERYNIVIHFDSTLDQTVIT